MLKQCLDSIHNSSEATACRVTLIDNASADGVINLVRENFPAVEIIQLPANRGFAAAVNRGLREATEPYVLMLNTDAILAPGALAKMVKALGDAGDEVAGVAPKMMSSAFPGVIDAVGTVMPPTGAGFNRGIGQCDLGQYDRHQQVAGVCFGAALLKRKLFEPGEVGPLYEGYFLYFEDSDWCMRATSQGYCFITVPEAVVLHLHSGVTRHQSLDFKYRLIELNTMKLVTRTFESPLQTLRIVISRSARLLARTFIRRRFIAANISTLVSFGAALPQLLKERAELKKQRIVSDKKIFRLAEGEDAFFDTVSYQPHRCLDSLIATYMQLLKQKQDAKVGKLLAALYRLRQEQITSGNKPVLDADTARLFAGQPECVRMLLEAATVK